MFTPHGGDTLRIRAYLDEHPVRRAVVVGGGFIGLEMAENLVHAGCTPPCSSGARRCCRPWTPTWRRRSTPISGARVELRLGARVSGLPPGERGWM